MSHTPPTASSTAPARRRERSLAAVGAVLAGASAWVIARYGAGIHLHTPAFQPTASPADLNAGIVAITAGVASMLGWALLATLERTTTRPRRTWTVIASGVLVLSISMPLSGHGITRANQIALICMHAAVGATLIALLPRTATPKPTRQPMPGAGQPPTSPLTFG